MNVNVSVIHVKRDNMLSVNYQNASENMRCQMKSISRHLYSVLELRNKNNTLKLKMAKNTFLDSGHGESLVTLRNLSQLKTVGL